MLLFLTDCETKSLAATRFAAKKCQLMSSLLENITATRSCHGRSRADREEKVGKKREERARIQRMGTREGWRWPSQAQGRNPHRPTCARPTTCGGPCLCEAILA